MIELKYKINTHQKDVTQITLDNNTTNVKNGDQTTHYSEQDNTKKKNMKS